jgi:glycyl-tRNA synthetase beta chain
VVLRDEGHASTTVEAVLDVDALRLATLAARLQAVRAFATLPEAPALASANKRIANILKKAEPAPNPHDLQPAALHEPAEQALHAALLQVGPASAQAVDAGRYTEGLQALAALKAPVDRFFDQVMVNTDDDAVRRNRLALLASLHRAMNRVADLSRLAA